MNNLTGTKLNKSSIAVSPKIYNSDFGYISMSDTVNRILSDIRFEKNLKAISKDKTMKQKGN